MSDNKPIEFHIDDHDVIYTLRTAHQNQTQMLILADQKANIIIGAIVIFLSLSITRYTVLSHYTHLYSTIFLLVLVLEMIALFLCVSVISPRFLWKRNDLPIEKIPNPLFFGFFTNYSEEEYTDFMVKKLFNNQNARELLLRDYYHVGHVLRRKFVMLKFAYLFATSGLIVTALLAGLIMMTP